MKTLIRAAIFAVTLFILMAQLFDGRSAAQTSSCPCEKFNSCDAKPKPSPAASPVKQPLKKQPLPPVKFQIRNVILKVNPNVDDKQLPGLDSGSGTAEDTEYNYNIGKANNTGHFAERRRYVYDTYKLAEAAHKNGEITRENFDKVTNILKDRLEKINEQEREAYSPENNEALQELMKDLETRVDAENEKRTVQTIKNIEKMDLEQFEKNIDAIYQVMSDNLAQGRALELMGANGQGAFQRFVSIIDSLRNKVAADCGKSRIKLEYVLGVERIAQLLGGAESSGIQPCLTRTILAKADFGGIQYEAKRCVNIHEKIDRSTLTGDWFITISGAMSGSGSAQVPESGSGSWEGKATVGGQALIEMTGTAVLVSTGSSCALRITSSMGVGTAGGYTASMPGVGGNLPISIVNEPCNVKEVKISKP
ncbi:MAG TPA: hypothetical protein VFY60_08605 [Pyrinomonadaceae bacterium]|nr:hypothetical protein [Pyrinomonadaceae bacterium]